MTFAVVLASRTAIWACADRKLTNRQNALRSSKSGVKITSIGAIDGQALLAYAGVGRVYDTQVSWWVYRTLRGLNWPLERLLERVSDAAQRRLVRHARQARTTHCFIASAIRNGRHCLYVIDVLKSPPQVTRFPPRSRSQGMIGISGIGVIYALRQERMWMRRITRLLKPYERGQVSGIFIASQLAALNRAVSAHARVTGDETVSAESVVIFRQTNSKRGMGGEYWCFDADGVQHNDEETQVPSVSHGFPVSELQGAIMTDINRRLRAMPADATANQRLSAVFTDEASLRVIGESISDKPDEEFR